MRVVVLTSDKYLGALRPLAYLLNKYWQPNPSVLVGGFTPPDFALPPNFTFHSIGAFEDYPVGKWSDGVIDLLSALPDEAFVLLLEDMWPTRPVNAEAVGVLYRYALQFKYVLKIDLCADRLYAWGMEDYGHVSYLDLVRSNPGSQYHMSMMPGVWRRDNLLSVLVRGESPWQVELVGTPRVSQRQDLLVLGTRQWPYRCILAHRGGNPGAVNLGGLAPEDVDTLRERGWI